jgi:predicted aspartyl protease
MTGVMADRMPPVCKTNNVVGLPITSKFDNISGSDNEADIEFDNNLEDAADYVVYFINESTLHQSPLIEMKVNNRFILNAIVDSGSEVNLISQNIYERLMKAGITMPVLPVENVVLVTAFGKRSNRIRVQVFIEIRVGVDRFECVFMVSSQLRNDAIIGCQFLKQYGIFIDFSKGSISYVREGVLKEHEFTTMTRLQSVTSNDYGEVREIILPNTHSTVQRTQSFSANCDDLFPS